MRSDEAHVAGLRAAGADALGGGIAEGDVDHTARLAAGHGPVGGVGVHRPQDPEHLDPPDGRPDQRNGQHYHRDTTAQ